MMRSLGFCGVVALVLLSSSGAWADDIYILHDGYDDALAAGELLEDAGHNVWYGEIPVLDYSAYDQVWDLRLTSAVPAADVTAFQSFLAGGGRMLFAGEHGGFFTRNGSLETVIEDLGGGSFAIDGAGYINTQPFTAAGGIVNAPNALAGIRYQSASYIESAEAGFLVTETAAGSGLGSLWAWDFNDISGAPDALMLVCLDLSVFSETFSPARAEVAENFAAYLGRPVPEPTSLALLAGGALLLRRRR